MYILGRERERDSVLCVPYNCSCENVFFCVFLRFAAGRLFHSCSLCLIFDLTCVLCSLRLIFDLICVLCSLCLIFDLIYVLCSLCLIFDLMCVPQNCRRQSLYIYLSVYLESHGLWTEVCNGSTVINNFKTCRSHSQQIYASGSVPIFCWLKSYRSRDTFRFG
jgi:hypothetical protein